MYDEIAEYYDILYATKDYESECQFLHAVFRRYRRSVRRILDLGCGTGSHSGILGQHNATPVADRVIVTGVDRSERMLARARTKFPDLDFRLGDITTYRSSDSYDAAIALFDVLGHISAQDLERVFHTANHHLTGDGLFIFDGWNRAALRRGQRPHGKLDEYTAPHCAARHLFKYVEMYYLPEDDAGHVEYVIIDVACQKIIRHEYRATLLTPERVRELCHITGFNLLSYTRHCTLTQRPLLRDWRVSVVLQKVTDLQSSLVA